MKYNLKYQANRPVDTTNLRKEKKKFSDVVLQVIRMSDIVLEVLEARFAEEMRNEEVEKLVKSQGKEILYVLNKSDLVREEKIKLRPSVFVSCKERKGIRKLRAKIKILAKKLGRDKVFVGVLGYPNVGKSSLINILSGRSSAKTAKQAGFTKGLQKIRLDAGVVLLDSPGVIPTEKYSMTTKEKMAEHVKFNARNSDTIKDPEFAVLDLMKKYSKEIGEYYGIEYKGDIEVFIETLGRKKNLIISGDRVDVDRTARIVIRDWQAGKIEIGKI